MDDDLRSRLWNALNASYFSRLRNRVDGKEKQFYWSLWNDFFKIPTDLMPGLMQIVSTELRPRFFEYEWHHVYSMLEFSVINYYDQEVRAAFIDTCNSYLEQELSGYRFIGNVLAPITSREEIDTIDSALASTKGMKGVHLHLQQSLLHLSDRQSPDYRNSIKEAISAVEGMCGLIAGTKATLGQAIKKIGGVHPALSGAFEKLYGYTSDAHGIRHAMIDGQSPSQEDAVFMLVSCSAFVNYLLVKASKAGIQLPGQL